MIDDDDDDEDDNNNSNLCNDMLRNTSFGVYCSGNNGKEKDVDNDVAAGICEKAAGTRPFINDDMFIDAQCVITCDNENKSDDVSDYNQSNRENVMLSSDTNTASYDVECVENDGAREDDNGSDVKQSTDSNNELSKNNDNSSIYTIFSETDDK